MSEERDSTRLLTLADLGWRTIPMGLAEILLAVSHLPLEHLFKLGEAVADAIQAKDERALMRAEIEAVNAAVDVLEAKETDTK